MVAADISLVNWGDLMGQKWMLHSWKHFGSRIVVTDTAYLDWHSVLLHSDFCHFRFFGINEMGDYYNGQIHLVKSHYDFTILTILQGEFDQCSSHPFHLYQKIVTSIYKHRVQGSVQQI